MAPAGQISKGNGTIPLSWILQLLNDMHDTPAACQVLRRDLRHMPNKKKAWSHQPRHSARPTTDTLQFLDSCHSWPHDSPPCPSCLWSQPFIPQNFRYMPSCASCSASCPLSYTAQFSNPSQNLGPRCHLCAPGLSGRQIQYQRGWLWRASKGTWIMSASCGDSPSACQHHHHHHLRLSSRKPSPHNSTALVFSETSSLFRFYCAVNFPLYQQP